MTSKTPGDTSNGWSVRSLPLPTIAARNGFLQKIKPSGESVVAISRDEVLKIADLAKLHLGEEELEEFTERFQSLLDYIEKLKQVDVETIEPTSHVSFSKEFEEHIFREDVVEPSLPVEESLANAPDSGGGHFRVPKVI
jgi:aspartyl-tRNA(Asn)/glutamyl-tRNA(Gln) amidotransferase subunit C